jgi:hypothetical protein
LMTIDSKDVTGRDSLSGRGKARESLNSTLAQMQVRVVALILDSKPEEAIKVLSRWYKISEPRLGIGVVEGKTKGVAAVYTQRRKEILAARREFLYDPFVLVHEFYHHLRSTSGKHRGTEKQADRFALEFIASYKGFVASYTFTGQRPTADQTSSSLASSV